MERKIPSEAKKKGESSRGSDPFALPPPSGKGKGEITSPPPDPDNPKRWALYENRKVCPERGINLTVLASTFVPDRKSVV